MARVFEVSGYRADTWPNDHLPPHVHLSYEGRSMRIAIGVPGIESPWICDEGTMPLRAQRDALRLVGEHQAECLQTWRRFHGHLER